ncbi:hypothetical protein scyTo_0003359 [Scyliorhinus torazame]|uniref:Uncharacterized protein n=1 Tax=Scyliorhinus torazame TaxID=75743 RepID=A0A401PMB1_SCYTO|nr:hypothetical protein [Scyliorhinus torazame]
MCRLGGLAMINCPLGKMMYAEHGLSVDDICAMNDWIKALIPGKDIPYCEALDHACVTANRSDATDN